MTIDDTLPGDLASTLAAFPEVEAGALPACPVGTPRWELGEVLGRGGMGTVYVARDQQFARDVALKQMHPDESPAATGRFVVEALVTGNLEHPGIPAVYERGEREGRPFYAMRKIEGKTLSEAVKEARSYEERLALLPAVVGIAHTLGFAHEHGVVHRDVKPDNVILGKHGETVLLDWGIAKVRNASITHGTGEGSKAVASGDTVDGSVMGTPAYMAPEQAAGKIDQIDERTDVFALGAILYFVLTGSAPYPGGGTAAVLRAALEGDRIPVGRAAPRSAPALQEVVETAMALDAGDRHPNAGAFADALQGFLTNQVQQRSSPLIRAIGTGVGIAAMLATAALTAVVASTSSSFAQQGWSAWTYILLPTVSLALALVEWRTEGRNHLAPLIFAFAVITVLAAIAGTVGGLGLVAQRAEAIPLPERSSFVLHGAYEVSGNLTVASFAAAIQLLAWALVTRVRRLAEQAG